MKIQPQWVVTPGKQTNNYINAAVSYLLVIFRFASVRVVQFSIDNTAYCYLDYTVVVRCPEDLGFTSLISVFVQISDTCVFCVFMDATVCFRRIVYLYR